MPEPLRRQSESGLWGIFARADHPVGYGSVNGTAHGYVVLFIGCKDADELAHVAKHLMFQSFEGLENAGQYEAGFLGEWYGGRFDLIASTTRCPMIEHLNARRFRSFGDNRFAGVFAASEVLNDGAASEEKDE